MRRALIVALCLGLPGCGGNSTTPTAAVTPAPTPAPCTQTTLLEGGGALASRVLDYESLTVATAGRIDIILDWTFATSQVGVYLIRAGTCSLAQFNANTCTFLIRSETTVKPRKLSYPGATPGSYEMLIAVFSAQDESLSTQVFLKSETCPPLATTPSVGSFVHGTVDAERRH